MIMKFEDACSKYIVESIKMKPSCKKKRGRKRSLKECNVVAITSSESGALNTPESTGTMSDSLLQITSQAAEIMCYINACGNIADWVPEKIALIKQEVDNLHQFIQGDHNRSIDMIKPAMDAAAIAQMGGSTGPECCSGKVVGLGKSIMKAGMPVLLGDKPAPILRPVPLVREDVKPRGTYIFDYPKSSKPVIKSKLPKGNRKTNRRSNASKI